MPIHDYLCTQCGKITEKLFLSQNTEEEIRCECGGTAHKIMSASNFHLIGDGWDRPAAKEPTSKIDVGGPN